MIFGFDKLARSADLEVHSLNERRIFLLNLQMSNPKSMYGLKEWSV